MTGSRPKVSVVVCTYNAGDYLVASIGSALEQSLRDTEIIVLDNASTDHTRQIIGQFSDPRFRYIRNDRNLGFVGNINKGLEIATGEFVAFLGADDIWERDYLRRAVELLETTPGAALAHGAVALIDSSGARSGFAHRGWASVTPGSQAFCRCFLDGFTFASVVVRTDHLRRIGPFDTSWGDIADSWLFLAMCLEGDIVCVTEPLVRYRVHDQSISLSMYRSGEMFRQHIRTAREALGWEKARVQGVTRYKGKILRRIALEAIRMAHISRLVESRRTFLRLFARIVREVPGVLLFPSTWARLAFGLLPRQFIRSLRERRKSVNVRKHSADSRQHLGAAS